MIDLIKKASAPAVLEKAQHNLCSIDIFSKLLQNRIIWIDNVIMPDTASEVVSQLLYLNSISSDDITMYINSPGGDVTSGLSIYDTMHHIKAKVNTINVGLAASMASILLAGGTGKRSALPHSRVMLHEPSMGSGYTKCSDFMILAEQLQITNDELFEILAKHTGKTKEDIEKDCQHDKWLTAKDALDYNIIDEIK